MSGILGIIATTKGTVINPITVGTNWGSGSCSNSTSCTITSSSQTLTVPAGNPGNLTFSITGNGGNFTYSHNGGTYVSGTTLSVASGDTLSFKITESSGPTSDTITVKDITSTIVGTFQGTNSHA